VRVTALAEALRTALAAIPGAAVHDLGRERCGIVTFTTPVAADQLKQRLAAERVNITTSSVFSTRHDMASRGLSLIARASVHYYNTEDEVARFAALVRRFTS
jgi:selenocysteine lyase/cysteine desulfurase